MGDILHALPAVTALRQAHPSWIIDWVVEPQWRALLAAEGSSGRSDGQGSPQPVVDKVHLANTKGWRKNLLSGGTLGDIMTLRRGLKAGGYDVMIDLQGAIRSAVVGSMAGCRRRIGEAEPRERAARWVYTDRMETSGAHVIDQDVELAACIAGDELEPVQPWLPVDPAAEEWVCRPLAGAADRPIVLIAPGAGWGAKRWPVDRYAAVARELVRRGFHVLINAGPNEQLMASEISESTGGAAVPVIASVAQLIALTRRVHLVIAGDTGPLHLACALGIPVVGIYGPTDPSRNGPYGVPFKVLRSPESRRDHTRSVEPEAGLLTIQPAEVVRAVYELLYPDSASETAR